LATFPRSIDRGLIEAVSESVASEMLSTFPRSIDRGLIEATLVERTFVVRSHFRDQLIAASLKLA